MAKNKVRNHNFTCVLVFTLYYSAFVGTWNVHGDMPNTSIKNWLQNTCATDKGDTVDPDFYVIG